MFTPKIGVSWSNLTITYFSNLLVQPPTSTLLRINITSHQKSQLWVDDFPNFPFGGICDRSLEGIYIYLWVFLWMCPIRRVGNFLPCNQANVQAKAMPRPPKACKEVLKGSFPQPVLLFFSEALDTYNECPDILIKYCKCGNILIYIISTLPETNIAPEKWMVGILVSLWDGLFAGAMLPVSFRECIYIIYIYIQHYTLDGCFMSCASRVDFVQKRQEKIEAKKMPTVAALWLFQLTVSGRGSGTWLKPAGFATTNDHVRLVKTY